MDVMLIFYVSNEVEGVFGEGGLLHLILKRMTLLDCARYDRR